MVLLPPFKVASLLVFGISGVSIVAGSIELGELGVEMTTPTTSQSVHAAMAFRDTAGAT
jgi:hypothetical protein